MASQGVADNAGELGADQCFYASSVPWHWLMFFSLIIYSIYNLSIFVVPWPLALVNVFSHPLLGWPSSHCGMPTPRC